MNPHHLLPASFAFLLLSCADDTPTLLSAEPDAAVACPLSGTVHRLGSTDEFASPEELPGWTRFRHDLRMDRTEMTQVEFASLLGRNPSTFRGDSLPVTDVSWYDAVLAANARSRRDGLDTVYEYASVASDAQGNTTNLEGLRGHLDRSGWRLPTEAEWEAAARAGTSTPWPWGDLSDSAKAGTYAWYQRNAGGRTHPVATKSPNAWGLYDMAGNAMEWVNDWKGSFPGDTVDEFAGQEGPDDMADVPLKGGAYRFDLPKLRPSNRGAIYAACRSSRAEYVGFRLCRGGFAARYASASGGVVYTPPVTLVRSDVASLVGSWEARLVFVNRSNGKGVLTWIDYNEPYPEARSLPDDDPVFHPVISPDGRWVAWSTALEGSTGASRIKARRLVRDPTAVLDLGAGAIPRWWVSGTDTFLVRASALDDLSPDWSRTKTTARRWSGGMLTGNDIAWASGSYHDGRSGPYLYTGYRRLRQYDTRTGTSRTLFTAPSNGKSANDTSQACNVSAAPDGSGRVMFLDFGYTDVSSVVGRSYGIHEIAFLADSTGRVLKTIPSPAGEAQWEHMEWSNASKWATSGAIDGTGAYRNLYLVDLESGTSTKIVSGEQLWQPDLWVGENYGALDVDPDSAGSYYTYVNPEFDWAYPFFQDLESRMSAFWMMKDSVDIAMMGSPRMGNAILHSQFRQGYVFNWSASNERLVGDVFLVRNYLLPQCPKLKAVGFTVMPAWYLEDPGEDWWTVMSNFVGILYDRRHDFWKSGVPDGFLRAVKAKLSDGAKYSIEKKEYDVPSLGWRSNPPALYVDDSAEKLGAGLPRNMALLEEMADTLARRGILMLLINFPQSPHYRQTPYAGYYGPTWDGYRRVMDTLEAFEGRHANVVLYDAYNEGVHDYDSLDFYDDSHLSRRGGIKISRRIDSIIARWRTDHIGPAER